MYFLYDNLTALIIATTVIFIVLSMQNQATQMGNQETVINAAKNQAHTLATWLERDLSQTGKNIDSEDTPIKFEEDSTALQFEYRNSSNERVEVRYIIENSDKCIIEHTDEQRVKVEVKDEETDEVKDEETENTCHLIRKEDSENEGRLPALDYFHVDILDGEAEVADSEEEYQSIRVQFAVAIPAREEFEKSEEPVDLPLEAIHRKITVPYPPAQLD